VAGSGADSPFAGAPKRFVEKIERTRQRVEQLVVAIALLARAGQQRLKACGFWRSQRARDVERAHHFPKAVEARIAGKSETLQKHFERNGRAHVGEGRAVEIEAKRVRRAIAHVVEPLKRRLRIDETADEPCARNAIDPQSPTRRPLPPLISRAIKRSNVALCCVRFAGRETLDERSVGCSHGCTGIGVRQCRKIIRRDEAREVALQGAKSLASLCFASARQLVGHERSRRLSDGCEFDRAVEERVQLVTLVRARDHKEMRLAVGAPDLALLIAQLAFDLGSLREQVNTVTHDRGAERLEGTPHADAIRPFRAGFSDEEEQPGIIGLHVLQLIVSRVTSKGNSMRSILPRSALLTTIAFIATALGCGHDRVAAADSALPLKTVATVALPGAASRFDYESLDPKTDLLFLAHLAASEVVVFNVKTNRVVATIPDVDHVHGVLAVPQLGRVFATATGTNEVAVIDERTLKVTAHIPGGTYPDGMAYDAADQKLYVSDEHGDTDTVIDTKASARIATIPLGGDVGNTQYDAATHRVYVNVQTRGDLVAIDPAKDAIVARYPLTGCGSNHGLYLDASHRKAYIACEDNAKLVVFDLASLKQTQTIDIGADPDVLAYDEGRSLLYVATESGTVSVLSADAALKKTGEAFLAKNAHIVAVDQRTHRVYFPVLADSGPRMLVMEPAPSVQRQIPR